MCEPPGMRFSYAETFCDPAYLAPLARAAEDAGFDSFVVPDSVLFPAHTDTRYPYTADGDRAFLEASRSSSRSRSSRSSRRTPAGCASRRSS